MFKPVRQYLGQVALEVGYDLIKTYVQQRPSHSSRSFSWQAYALEKPPILSSKTPIINLNNPLEPQITRVEGVYQRGFIGLYEAKGAPRDRIVGFINGRCNSPLHFQEHARRLSSYGLHVIGLYNPCIPGAPRLVDYSQALKILVPTQMAPSALTYLPDWVHLGLSLNTKKKFKIIAHSHGYGLLAQSLLLQGKLWAEHGKQVDLYGFAGITSIPQMYGLQRVNFCNQGDWAVKLMLLAQKNFDDLKILPKPKEEGSYHGLWGPGYFEPLHKILLT